MANIITLQEAKDQNYKKISQRIQELLQEHKQEFEILSLQFNKTSTKLLEESIIIDDNLFYIGVQKID